MHLILFMSSFLLPSQTINRSLSASPYLENVLLMYFIKYRLAKAELYLTLANVFRRFENQELYETTRMDVDLKHDMFLPYPDLASKGVRVMFK